MSSTTGRRFLSLAAVEPRGCVAPAPLLEALLALLREISSAYGSARFPVNRAPARAAARQVRLLLPSLEGLPAVRAAVPALLELYLASQRFRLLLHDLSRRGTRLLALLLRDVVARELHAISRAFALGLDAFPLPDGHDEVAEAFRLAGLQARRDRDFLDPSDERAFKIARSALDGFASGLAPDLDAVRELLNHLGIQSWSSCNDEVSFLEEELKLSSSSGVKKDTRHTALLSSLLALALYSRSVCCEASDLSDLLDPVGAPEPNDPHVSSFDCLKPDEFRCPISLDLMTDPVTVSTGQTYNRSSILRWFKDGNVTCPVTGKKLAHTDLIPNHALASVIRRYCVSKRVQLPESQTCGADRNVATVPAGDAAPQALRMLAVFLVEMLREGGEGERHRAVYEVRLLARLGAFHRACLAEAGAMPWLLHLLASWDVHVQENAMAAVLNLAKQPVGRRAVYDSGGIAPILEVLADGLTADARHNAAAALFYLSSVEEYSSAIGQTPGALVSLIGMLVPTASARGKRNASMALHGLLGHAGNLRRVVAAGAVPALAGIVSPAEREDVVLVALALMAALADCWEGAAEMLRLPVAVRAVAELLRSSASQAAKEWCVSILLCLCKNGGGNAVGCVGGLPALMPSLYSQLTEGSQRASKKASSLIGILHRSTEAGPWVRVEEDDLQVR